jgi:hypothetical protein
MAIIYRGGVVDAAMAQLELAKCILAAAVRVDR